MPNHREPRSRGLRVAGRGLGLLAIVGGAGAGGYALGAATYGSRGAVTTAQTARARAASGRSRSASASRSQSAVSPSPSKNSSPPDSSATTSSSLGSAAAVTGLYVDGPAGTPQYFLSWTARPNGTIGGAVNFAYQDGQTSVVFTFTGALEGSHDVATLTPQAIPENTGSASQPPCTVPAAISALLSRGSISLGECTTYLHFAPNEAACTFTASTNDQ
ncbi:hypothetical protein [Ferrimicrobium sp.]|uniref:hypothetical protein n=1 Tax=Ferrimicrobium sp. TaxID=2926050 RepID=UPI002634F11D|nr:hypothetical protein [Ferrimicrobium sp.]